MASVKPKAIYIGPQQINDYLVRIRQDWEFYPPVENIQALWDGLSSGKIPSDIQVILILDSFFDPTGIDKSFESLVSTMSPHCFFAIINYNSNHKEQIREQISQEASRGGVDITPIYYFIDPTRPNHYLDDALAQYIATSQNEEVKAILTGRTAPATPIRNPTSYTPEQTNTPNPYLGQVVAITSSKGGSGKSTVAITLGTYLAHSSINSVKEGLEERPLKVIIVDLDVRDGQIGFITGSSKPTIVNLLLKGIEKETIEETVVHSSRLKCDLLLAPKKPRVSEDTPPEFYVELLQKLRYMYDYIILDTSVNYLDPLLEKVAYPTADQIIFVSDIVINSVFSMTRWIQEVINPKEQGGMGIQKRKIGIVVNKTLADVNMSGERIAQAALGLPVITAIPSNPKLIAHAANMQSMEIVLQHPAIAHSIRKLAKAIAQPKYKLSDNLT